MSHTPGPWAYALEYGHNITEPPRITTVGRCANYVIGLPSDYPGGNYRDGDPSGDEESDARLMAAAPELLAALKQCHDNAGSPELVYQVSKAAIAKAEGTTP
jgi:hypothetical protein